jgi:hypothetical protein
MIALAAQEIEVPVRGLDALVGGDPAECARECARLRASGWRVRASAATDTQSLRAEAQAAGAFFRLNAGACVIVRVWDEVTFPLEPLPAPPTIAAPPIGGLR